MLVYFFNNFESVGLAEIERLLPMLPQQHQDAIAGTKLLSRKREIAVSYLLLAYAIRHNQREINDDKVTITEYEYSTINSLFLSQTEERPMSDTLLPILNFRIAEHGKPYLTDHKDIYFNISHCREAIVTAVSNIEVGVDVEGNRNFSDQLIERAFDKDEQQSVHEALDKKMEFARIWTRKEAFFKWTGTGILIDHIKDVEKDASAAGCKIKTLLVTPREGNAFYLSVAQ